MWTSLDVGLVIALALFCGFILGTLGALSFASTHQARKEIDTEKSAMWSINGRAYRLVRSPGMDEMNRLGGAS